MLTVRQKLILFLISCKPGLNDIYRMVRIFDRADFPAKITENLKPMLDNNLIFVAENFDNGTPNKYEITGQGMAYLKEHLSEDELIDHIKTMYDPALLLKITQSYFVK